MYTSSHLARQRIQKQMDELAVSSAKQNRRWERWGREQEEKRREKLKKEDPQAYQELLKFEAEYKAYQERRQEEFARQEQVLVRIVIVFLIGVLCFMTYIVNQ